jgi:hypothetical protein
MLSMVCLRKYAKRLEKALGKEYSPRKNSIDCIDEDHWLKVVVAELNGMTIECARELQQETGTYPKETPEYPNGQPLELAPPTRLLSLSLILSYWLGWVNEKKNG